MDVFNEKRERYLDILKGIAIFMVVNVHFPPGTKLFTNGITFHLTSFFLVAGILIRKKEEDKLLYKDTIIKKLKSIIYPYFTLSLVYIIFWSIIKHSIQVDQICYTLSFLGIGTLWFLPPLCIGEIMFIGILKKAKKYINVIIPLLLLIALIFSYFLTINGITGVAHLNKDRIFESIVCNLIIVLMESLISCAYIGVGYILECIIQKTNCLRFKKIYYFLLGSILLVFNYFVSTKIKVDIHYATVYTPIFYLLGTFLGTMGVFNIAYSLENNEFVNKTVGWGGRNSLIIMTTHLEYKVVHLSYRIAKYIPIHNQVLTSLIMLAIILLIEVIIVNTVNNTKLKYLYKMPKIKKIRS